MDKSVRSCDLITRILTGLQTEDCDHSDLLSSVVTSLNLTLEYCDWSVFGVLMLFFQFPIQML